MTSALIPADRRSFRRYHLETVVRYRPAGGPLNTPWKQGRAWNMSANGILIHIPNSFALGTRLELSMEWTGLYHGREAMRLFLIASITRIDRRGVALRIQSHRFHDASTARVRFPRVQTAVA